MPKCGEHGDARLLRHDAARDKLPGLDSCSAAGAAYLLLAVNAITLEVFSPDFLNDLPVWGSILL